jgi:hypothetical protein
MISNAQGQSFKFIHAHLPFTTGLDGNTAISTTVIAPCMTSSNSLSRRSCRLKASIASASIATGRSGVTSRLRTAPNGMA